MSLYRCRRRNDNINAEMAIRFGYGPERVAPESGSVYDVFTHIDKYRPDHEQNALAADHIDQFIR